MIEMIMTLGLVLLPGEGILIRMPDDFPGLAGTNPPSMHIKRYEEGVRWDHGEETGYIKDLISE